MIALYTNISCLGGVFAKNTSLETKEEKTAWHTWNAWPEASTVFRKLSQYPPVLGEDDQSILEKFVVIMYDISSATENRS